MKIILLLFAFTFSVGASVKKSADDLKEISLRNEVRQNQNEIKRYEHYPNLLPEVEVIAQI